MSAWLAGVDWGAAALATCVALAVALFYRTWGRPPGPDDDLRSPP